MVENTEFSGKNTVLFDLDNTLFDHYYSLRNAISVNREQFGLDAFTVSQLIDVYNASLQVAYDRYLQKEISYDEKDSEKVRLFFENLSLPVPGSDDIDTFLNSYNEVYFRDRRATPGSIETLVRLNEHGFRLGVVTNGQTKDQIEKMQAIGVAHLIDALVTSEQVGYPKPSRHLFAAALGKLDAEPGSTLLVGDDAKTDIEGSLSNDIDAVLYKPTSKETKIEVLDTMVYVIHHMKELLPYLGIEEPSFAPAIEINGNTIHFSGLGIDIVTAPRHCMSLGKETIQGCFAEMEQLCLDLSKGIPINALARLKKMIMMTAHDANLIDENRVEIAVPGLVDIFPPAYTVVPYEERRNSIRVENFSGEIRLVPDSNWSPDIEKIAMLLRLFQGYLDKLSIDHPRAGIRLLRDSFYLISEQAGIDSKAIVIRGERIEEEGDS